jgi:uncharacterized repeat protein (TIGR03943 family)
MQNAILVGIGIIAVQTAWGGLYLNFVKPGLRWWLLAAGAVVMAMGTYGTFTDDDGTAENATGKNTAAENTAAENNTAENIRADAEHEDTHMAHHGPRIGWLLLVPFVVLSVVVPPSLGAFAAERDSGALRSAPAPDTFLPNLPITSAPVTMTLSEYAVRAVWEKGRSLTTHRVRLVGFASARRAGSTGQTWYLTRMALSCCAADAWAIKIDVRGGESLPEDTWVTVTGSWVKSAGSVDAPDTLAALQIESMQTVANPPCLTNTD